jgi:hypothetical protein
MIENGEYVHSVFCSGSRRHPRMPGHSCYCHRVDIMPPHFGETLAAQHDRETGTTKRSLYVAECACGNRREYPHTSEYIPREVWCPDCNVWNPVKELSWEGPDLTNLLPVIPR